MQQYMYMKVFHIDIKYFSWQGPKGAAMKHYAENIDLEGYELL